MRRRSHQLTAMHTACNGQVSAARMNPSTTTCPANHNAPNTTTRSTYWPTHGHDATRYARTRSGSRRHRNLCPVTSPTTTPSNGHRTTMLAAHTSALAAFKKIWSRKKSSARPVCKAMYAASTTSATDTTTARGRSPRATRTTAMSTPHSTAASAPTSTDRPASTHPRANASGGREASTAPPRPPSNWPRVS
nr:hypothetical protein GCM10017745_02240 [Saccharothrix mutabilis subsp. capreolus]